MGCGFPVPPIFLALPMAKMSGTVTASEDRFTKMAGEMLLEQSRTQNIRGLDIIKKRTLPGWLVKLE